MDVTLAFSLWMGVAWIAFYGLAPRQAVLAVFLGGWLLLPVGEYAAVVSPTVFPYWIIGTALPSDMLVTKAWLAPLSALLGVALFDRPAICRLRFKTWDVPMALWCCWPLLQAVFVSNAQPSAPIASAYLLGSWGCTWLLGRLYFADIQAQGELLTGLAWAGLVCVPIALVEGIWGPFLYGWLYSAHPFVSDGAQRYIGWRPMGFFEHGNQYGMWVCACALACLWVWQAQAFAHSRPGWKWAALCACVVALASQSMGAIFLLCFGLAGLQLLTYVRLKSALLYGCCAAVLLGGAYLSGRVPLTHWAKETPVGQAVVGAVKSTGRGSFTWRIAQDQKALALVKKDIVVGSAQWAWWQALATRPWGLGLLLVGQFGLVGLGLVCAAVVLPAVRKLAISPAGSPWNPQGAPAVLAVLVLMACLDAGLNAFVFFPAVLVAAALVPAVAELRRWPAGAAIPVGTTGLRL